MKAPTQHIFDYVSGATVADPVERHLNNTSIVDRYEVFEDSIYDYKSKKFILQSESFKKFQKKLTLLRRNFKTPINESLIDECVELSNVIIDITI